MLARLLALAALAAALRAAEAACPPANFSTVEGFSLGGYISRPWFSVQQARGAGGITRARAGSDAESWKQAPNSYQPREALYCVRAEYRRDPRDASRIQVFNQARAGSVTGALRGTNMLLSAVVKARRASRTGLSYDTFLGAPLVAAAETRTPRGVPGREPRQTCRRAELHPDVSIRCAVTWPSDEASSTHASLSDISLTHARASV